MKINITTINKIGKILAIISLLITICTIIYGAFTVHILFGIAIIGCILKIYENNRINRTSK